MNERLSLERYSELVLAQSCPSVIRFGTRLYLFCAVAFFFLPESSEPKILVAYLTGLSIFLAVELWLRKFRIPARHAHLSVFSSGAVILLTSSYPYLLGEDPYLTFYLQLLLLAASILILKVKWMLGAGLVYIAIWLLALVAADDLSSTDLEGVFTTCLVAVACFRTRRSLLKNEFELHCRERDTQERLREALRRGQAAQETFRVRLADQQARLEKARESHKAEQDRVQQVLLGQEVSISLGRLAGGLAHEFNNSLTSVRGYLELARYELPPELHDQAVTDLEEALSRATELSSYLVKASGSEVLNPVVVRVRTLLENLRHTSAEPIAITAEGPNVRVRVDLDAWLQICQNLLRNARDAAGPEGQVEFLVESSEDGVVFRVEDDGPGFPAEGRDKLLQPYYTTKQKQHATGLGLAIVAAFAKQHGAQLALGDRIGGGASVRFTLPACGDSSDLVGAAAAALPSKPQSTAT